jgi:hypothetical protein
MAPLSGQSASCLFPQSPENQRPVTVGQGTDARRLNGNREILLLIPPPPVPKMNLRLQMAKQNEF